MPELTLAARQAAIPGTPRVLTVTNTSTDVSAVDVALDATALPVGTTVASDCGTLAAGASCRITLTPGAVATTAPVKLSMRGSNTNAVETAVHVVAYGSEYQGGYVFALDDSTTETGSVGGKVVAKRDVSGFALWSPNADAMTEVDEFATAPCVGAQDGACNTNAIVAHYRAQSVDPSDYAAGRCDSFSDEGYADWYLPSICEMGVDENSSSSGCGSSAAPGQQNIFLNLVQNGDVAGMTGRMYWTSTAASGAPAGRAWMQYFALAFPSGALSHQLRLDRAGVNLQQRCVRAIRP